MQTGWVGFEVDWRHGAEHMWNRHQISADQAAEALTDDECLVAHPDPASRSDVSARVIGYSQRTDQKGNPDE